MESILFEKQQAALCGQHALNMLLQGSYFNEITLAEIAQRLDQEENKVLDSSSKNKKSQNMNDSGFFSIQVIAEALKPFDLELTSITHPNCIEYRQDPKKAKAFICNMREHWFTIRKFANQWFALNSVAKGPELLSDTYLEMYLKQLTDSGYSIFVVIGILPDCRAETVIAANPVKVDNKNSGKPKPKEFKPFQGQGKKLGGSSSSSSGSSSGSEDEDLKRALALSLADVGGSGASSSQSSSSQGPPTKKTNRNIEDEDLQRAIQLSLGQELDQEANEQDRQLQLALLKSMAQASPEAAKEAVSTAMQAAAAPAAAKPPPAPVAATDEQQREEMRRKREAFLARFDSGAK